MAVEAGTRTLSAAPQNHHASGCAGSDSGMAKWIIFIRVQGEAGFAADFGERVSRGFGIEFGDGGERITVEDGRVQNLDGRLNGIACRRDARFAANASTNGLQIFAAGGAEAIDKVEGDLRVEDGLTRGLEGEELRGLRLQFFDAGAAGFGDGTEKDQGEAG